MTSIDRLTHPDQISRRATHLQEGFIIGWVPGEITDLNDPEKIGRIRVRCDLIQPDTDLPNESDGWSWVLEDFVCNAAPGGTHRLLKVGTQVALLPMMGDARQMLILGCIPSRVDKPHPDMDRNNEIYGKATPNGVVTAHNDREQSRLDVYPTGVTQQISKDGDISMATREQARLQLSHDGTAKMENPKSVSQLTPEGTVIQRSAEGASSILRDKGTVELFSKFASGLKLDAVMGQLKSPLNKLSQLLKDAQKALPGYLQQAQGLLKQLKGLTGGVLGDQIDLDQLLGGADRALGQLNTQLTGALEQGIKSLEQVQKFAPEDLVSHLAPQIQTVIDAGLHKFMPQVEALLKQPGSLSGAALATQIQTLLPADLQAKLDLSKIVPFLDSLRHDPAAQAEAVLDAVMPQGFKPVESLVSLGLHGTLGVINDLTKEPLEPGLRVLYDTAQAAWSGKGTFIAFLKESGGIYSALSEELERRAAVIQKATPKDLQQHIKPETVTQLVEAFGNPAATPLQTFTGEISQGIVNQAAKDTQALQPAAGAVAPLQALVQAVIQKDNAALQTAVQTLIKIQGFEHLVDLGKLDLKTIDLGKVDDLLKAGINALEKELRPLLTKGLHSVEQLLKGLPSDISGAAIEAIGGPLGTEVIKAYTSAQGAGAQLLIQKAAAELIGPLSKTSLFAGLKSAGIQTPWGKFGLGGDGGSFMSQGQLAMRVLQGAGQSAGLMLDPAKGASLSSFFEHDWHWEGDKKQAWTNQSASVTASGQTVKIQSLNEAGEALHRITVSPDGIFLNGIEVGILTRLPERFLALETRLAAIERGLITP